MDSMVGLAIRGEEGKRRQERKRREERKGREVREGNIEEVTEELEVEDVVDPEEVDAQMEVIEEDKEETAVNQAPHQEEEIMEEEEYQDYQITDCCDIKSF